MNVKGFRKKVEQRSSRTAFKKSTAHELSDLKKKNLLRSPVCISSSTGPEIRINDKTFVNYSSNDYLNLSKHPRIIKAAESAIRKYGLGSGSSRLISGTYHSHQRLEERIAEFKNREAALVFNSGYAANTGIIPVIGGSDTAIFSDELNHASIVDGTRLARADVQIYRHKDIDCLESLLKKYSGKKSIKQKLIITDTLFSMDGDIAPLPDIVALAEKYDAILMIDDAHATGILGEKGRGGLEHFGIQDKTVIQMGTLSKALGCFGAFVACNSELCELLKNRARSFMYSTSLPPAVAEAGKMAVEIVESGSVNLRKRLWKNRKRLYEGLTRLGFETLNSESPIVPILIGDAKDALKAARHLYENRIFAPAIRPPTVPEGKSRIRFSVTSAHTNDNIDLLLNCLNKY